MTRDEPPSELYKAAEVGTNLAEVGTDCISRQSAIDALKRKQDDGKGDLSRFYNTIIQHDIEAIMQLPPADEPKHWIQKMHTKEISGAVCYIPKWHCPNCDLEYDPAFAQRVNFCYACGQLIEGLVDDVNEVTE